MSIQNFITNYAAYNLWANKKIIDWLKNVPEEYLYQQTTSSFTSIDYTLQHILRAQKFWLLFIAEEDITHFSWAVRENEVPQILDELEAISSTMKAKFSSYSDAELLQTLHLNISWCTNSLSRYEYMVHVINHSTYHRGQIITMARTVGIEEGFVNTDYNFFNTEMNG